LTALRAMMKARRRAGPMRVADSSAHCAAGNSRRRCRDRLDECLFYTHLYLTIYHEFNEIE
jgi:hypothetical protein